MHAGVYEFLRPLDKGPSIVDFNDHFDDATEQCSRFFDHGLRQLMRRYVPGHGGVLNAGVTESSVPL